LPSAVSTWVASVSMRVASSESDAVVGTAPGALRSASIVWICAALVVSEES